MASESGCKVDEAIQQYGLETADPRYESLDDGLLRRWTGEASRDAVGYRTLTEWFNKRLLKRVYDRHGRDALGNRVKHDYEALTSEEDSLAREDVVESLEADGIDAATVRDDMVSWGTMRTHLQECLDGTKDVSTDSDGWERETVAMAASFATEKAESALSSLGTKSQLRGVDNASVSVEVQLSCDHCPTRVPFDVAVERGYVCEQHADATATHP